MMIDWRKSSYSGSSNDEMCVEVAHLAHGIAVRDSKDPDGDRLAVSGEGFSELVRQIREGSLDRPGRR
ncbi:DUF397 domain-containing protein [Spirillospora sp. CA-142024]|uniref:DUF397 domain-containing protein n=1 Tax=Spirillospora sp. CA-142024 TaxID=3240036 RepID=UPI003D89C051